MSMIYEKNTAMLDERRGRWYNKIRKRAGNIGFLSFRLRVNTEYRGSNEPATERN